MDRSRRFGYLVYPLLVFFLFTSALLAQEANSAPTPSQQSSPQEPENPQQEQIRLSQEAQARIHARRQQRIQQNIQQTYSHHFEVYGGGGYQRFRTGEHLQQINEYVWNAGFTDYLRPRLGITAEMRGNYGVAYVGQNIYALFKPSISQYLVMAGPQYRIVRMQHVGVSGQLLAGVAKGIFNGNSGQFPGTLLGMWPNGTSLSVSAGVPIDFNLGPSLAVRLMPDYLLTRFGGTAQIKNLGFTSGLVFRFGHR